VILREDEGARRCGASPARLGVACHRLHGADARADLGLARSDAGREGQHSYEQKRQTQGLKQNVHGDSTV
jgi:hypothetical protein